MRDAIKKRILILDGAMGTMIGQRLGHTGNSDELNLTRPDVIADIHRQYLEAGADIITTNTFSSQRISQADYHLEHKARQMALEGARIARRCADEYSTPDRPRFVAGSMGPTNKTCSMSPDVSQPALRSLDYDTLYSAYLEQASALVEGGVDAILIETIFDTLNAKAAIDATLHAIGDVGDIPIMLSVTVSDLAGRTLSGQTLDAFLASISPYPIFSVGLNCSFGARQMLPFMRQLAAKAPFYTSAYPNAGLPNAMGLYDETAQTMAPQMGQMVDEGLVNIIGGCCGTTPEFIALYGPLVKGRTPRTPAPKPDTIWLSGLEQMQQAPFTNIGERCNVAGSRRFLRLIGEHRYDEAVAIARQQVADGAMVLDVNMDDGLLDARSEMVAFLNTIAAEPDIAAVPVMVDSSDWNVVVAALKCIQGKSIVNSISLKEGEETFISHALDAKRFGAAVVVMCFDEQGQATTYERKVEIARRSYRILTEQVGMSPHDIIFDPNVLAIATGIDEHDAYALDFIRATAWICQNLPGAHVSGGVSNLSFAFRGNNYIREAMHAVFLYHAIQAGMDFAILNPAAKVLYSDIPADQLQTIEDAILCRRPGAAERLTALAASLSAATTNASQPTTDAQPAADTQRTAIPIEERLQQALVSGNAEHLEADMAEALALYPLAVDIIQGPLMAGMNTVGQLFGQGKMFLPQVVKSARTMRQAVSILQPHISAERPEGAPSAGRVLLATVKGDVHDIGKNIVGVIMTCNGYEVIDMGVMVPAEQIVSKAIEEHVDMIGLSGLITPSLEEMVSVARQMQQAGLHIPIMIGGATTSELHVALKIAPVYSGPVVWMRDASQNPLIAARLMDSATAPATQRELSQRYQQMRSSHASQQTAPLLPIDEARKRRGGRLPLVLLVLLATLLLWLGQPAPLSAQPKRQFRGAWIQCVNGQFKGIGTAQMQQTLAYQLDELQKDGCNAIIFQVRPECDALYPSTIEPWSYYLTGSQGQQPSPYWDPLQWMIEQSHRRGMELHAWINPYRAKTKVAHANDAGHVVCQHPEWTFQYDGLTLLNPALQESRDYICRVVADIVSRYDVDGLHIDDYFYPYPAPGIEIPDAADYRQYQQNTRHPADRASWRRHNVDLFVRQLYETVHRLKPWVKVGISPFGIYRNKASDPSGSNTNGLQNYDQLYADVLLWDRQGWMDYCVPQLYWEIGHTAADYAELIGWWSRNLRHTALYIGEDVERTAKHQQLAQKMALHQQHQTAVSGHVLWYAKAAVDDVGHYGTQLRTRYWRHPALQPLMPHIDHKAPKKPRKVKIIDIDGQPVLFWTAPKGKGWKNEACRYVVYRFEPGQRADIDSPSAIQTVTTATHYELSPADLARGCTYAVTALDRLSNESRAVTVSDK
ncbi:MAG: methionine synthase [Prevotella sp.]|nr:methionine synthase [Prevotella sp.]